MIVDISRWQGVVPVSTMKSWKAFGVTKVVVKAGGADDGLYEDRYHKQNVANAHAAVLLADRYFFNGNDTSVTAAADGFASYVAGTLLAGELLWWDVENETGEVRWNCATLVAAANRLATHGYPASRQGVYMSSSVTGAENWQAAVNLGLVLWVAQYGTNNGNQQGSPSISYWKTYTYWQYTSVGQLPNYSGNLDLSTSSGAPVVQLAAGNSYDSINQTGKSTSELQKALNAHGAKLVVDNIPGPVTQAAIITFQKANGLTPDGIAGPQTTAKLWPAPTAPAPVGKNLTPRPVIDIQRLVGAAVDNVYGPSTTAKVKVWQKTHGLTADGIWGPASDAKGFPSHPQITQGATGQAVKDLQTALNRLGYKLKVDGIFGAATEAAVRDFQSKRHLSVDGIVGTKTWGAL